MVLLRREEESAGVDSLAVAEALDLSVETFLRSGKASDPAARAAAERTVAIKRARRLAGRSR